MRRALLARLASVSSQASTKSNLLFFKPSSNNLLIQTRYYSPSFDSESRFDREWAAREEERAVSRNERVPVYLNPFKFKEVERKEPNESQSKAKMKK